MNYKELISNAYKDGQIASESGDEITTSDIQRGLRQLNNIFTSINTGKNLITYITTTELDFISKQEVYNVDFVSLKYAYFLLGDLRYNLEIKNIVDYYDSASIESVSGVPSMLWVEPKPDFTIDIHVYMFPSTPYKLFLRGFKAFKLIEISDINTVIPIELNPFISYLTYKTAFYLRQVMSMPPNTSLDNMIAEAEMGLRSTAVKATKVSPPKMGRGRGTTWADVNLGRGWKPRG